MDQCRQRCWIAGGVAGLIVLAALSLIGSASLFTGILLGALVGGLLGGLLVWGACEGSGSKAENEALMAVYWQPEPFHPSRRVVGAGGKVVSQQPLSANAPHGLSDSAPLESITLQASRDPAVSRLVEVPVSEPEQAPASAEYEAVPAPSETVALLATPSIASAIPITPLPVQDAGPEAEADAGRTGTLAADAEAAPSRAETVAAAAGIALGPDRVATTTEPQAEAEPVPADADELMRIDGVGPMQAGWLRDNGVTRLAEIAAWDDADIARFSGMMGRDGHRIRAEDWAGQAARLLDRGQVS